MKLTNPQISILIPVYKVPKEYLTRCIESCINQSLKEIEIIIVDDGSPDNCGEICDSYSDIDKRIKVIHKENGGLSAARNTAFDAAQGQYILFLDGDDFLEIDACEVALECAKRQNVQIVMFDQITEYNNSSKTIHSFGNMELEFRGEKCKELQNRVLDFNGKIAMVFCKLIERNFLNRYNIRHVDQLKQGAEGFVFNISLFEYAESAYYIPVPLLHYVYNEKSISHTANEENNYLIVRCFEYIKDYIKQSKNCDVLENLLYRRMLYVICTTAITGYFNPAYKVHYSVKKSQFRKFMKEPFVECSLKKADIRGLDFQRRFVLLSIRLKQYWVLFLLGLIRRKQLGNR